MNGNEFKIEIFKPFGEAFELMKRILFQPFDFKKWLLIGFAAWLANLGSGGGGGNFSYPDNRPERAHEFNEAMGHIPQPVLITGISILVCLILLVIVLFAWLRARGRFVFVDCIVRNRTAIAEAWKGFRAEGNSFFLFSLLIALVVVSVIVSAGLVLIVPFMPAHGQAQPDIAFWVGISLTGFISIFLVCVWGMASQLMVPIMYRQRCRARVAFAKAVHLVSSHPGPILLYVLFFLLLAVAMVMISCAVTCATCCIAAVPYVGTVILLPISVTLGAFVLLFLRQFGPDYDVWADFMPAEYSAVLLPAPGLMEPEAS